MLLPGDGEDNVRPSNTLVSAPLSPFFFYHGLAFQASHGLDPTTVIHSLIDSYLNEQTKTNLCQERPDQTRPDGSKSVKLVKIGKMGKNGGIYGKTV